MKDTPKKRTSILLIAILYNKLKKPKQNESITHM